MLDETPMKKPRICSAGGKSGGGDEAAASGPVDRLSALPDAMLHHVMSFLRAWEVARTCVLSRRWRRLWATAPCVDLRVWRLGRHRAPPSGFNRFVYRYLLEREASAPVDTLRLLSSPGCGEDNRLVWSPCSEDEREDYSNDDVDMWIHAAIKRRARVIHLTVHPLDDGFCDLERVNVISCHLQDLKLSGFWLSEKKLTQICSQCPSLQVLDLKNCLLGGPEISSASLKSLAIIECRMRMDLIIAAPNLVSLHCVTPHHRAPLFENMGLLTTATIVLDDSFLHVGYEYEFKDTDRSALEEDSHSNSDSNSGCSLRDDPDYCSDACSDASTCEYNEIPTDYIDKQCGSHGEDQNHCRHCNCFDHGPYWSNRRHRERFNAGTILGGHNVLRSLSNATSLELLANAGEVILNRELKTCPNFCNLKTLSLGEWCIAADFDPLVSFLQHSPNLESICIELKLDDNGKKAMEDSTGPEERSFGCRRLKMVKIKCSKDDTRVHSLARLFMNNGVPIENIYVRQHSICHPINPR